MLIKGKKRNIMGATVNKNYGSSLRKILVRLRSLKNGNLNYGEI